jgi:hypothetical protein
MLTLVRFCYAPDGTFGYIDLGVTKVWTVEREWADNQPSKSCLPVGVYDLLPYSTEKYPNTYALQNKGLQVWAYWSAEARRFACVLHSANFPFQLEGCVSTGRDRRGIAPSHHWGVSSSRIVTRDLVGYIKNNNVKKLAIVNQEAMGLWTPQTGTYSGG